MHALMRTVGITACILLATACWAQPSTGEGGQSVVPGESRRGLPVRGLRATLLPLQTRYAPGEKLRFLLYVTNVIHSLEEEIGVEAGMVYNCHIRVHITDADGHPVRYPGDDVCKKVAPPRGPEGFVRLGIGCTYGRQFSEGEPPDWRGAIAQPGVYKVHATFEATERGTKWKLHAWTGVLESNEVEIRVRERPPGRAPE